MKTQIQVPAVIQIEIGGTVKFPEITLDGERVVFMPPNELLSPTHQVVYWVLLHYMPGRFAQEHAALFALNYMPELTASNRTSRLHVKRSVPLSRWCSLLDLCEHIKDVPDDGTWSKVHSVVGMNSLLAIYRNNYPKNGAAAYRLFIGRDLLPDGHQDSIEGYRWAEKTDLTNESAHLIYRGLRHVYAID